MITNNKLTDLKNEAVKLPPSMARSPNNLFWFAFLRIFSSMVFSLINLIKKIKKINYQNNFK